MKPYKLKTETNNRVYKLILLNFLYPMYWDECWAEHPHYRKGFKNSKKRLFTYQVRQYRTWKYNRKTKWKI